MLSQQVLGQCVCASGYGGPACDVVISDRVGVYSSVFDPWRAAGQDGFNRYIITSQLEDQSREQSEGGTPRDGTARGGIIRELQEEGDGEQV